MTKQFSSRLSQRIILSFVLLTTIVSGLFAIGLTATIHYVEASLVRSEMPKDFSRIFDDYRNGRELRLEEGASFFPEGAALPDYLESIPTGYSEVVLNDLAYYVYHRIEGKKSYFLVKDQTSFERAEILLQRAVFSGFVLCVLASFVLGWFMVKQVIAPVRRLTRQVADREALREQPLPLASEHADDEVGALARAFDATFAKLEQALRREALFTSDVSHELRTPLLVIQSACEILVAKKELDGYSRQRIESIREAVRKMKELVETFLALARGKDNQAETATLDAIVKSEFPNWTQMAQQKENLLLLEDKAKDQLRKEVKYPAVLLRTVIDNLIRNAVRHTAGGEIVLVLRDDSFELRDTGSGIAPDEMDKVFEPYYRGTASRHDGLGLGLSLVRRICERENWTITLARNHPQGCWFRINLA
ncbi:MAG: HAMP domain-containing sensor histidine kinase [Syntrophotaleaceae bacterium]